MEIIRNVNDLIINGDDYQLKYNTNNEFYIKLLFKSGVGAELFIPSGCDSREMIDELVCLDSPKVIENTSNIELIFSGITTLWDKVEYKFICYPEKVLYGMTVFGDGKIDNVRFFEGFLQNDPRMEDAYYPYFNGSGRQNAYHRPIKEFIKSSTPMFDRVYSFDINCLDKRDFMYYESTTIRVHGDRKHMAGDWLVTPPPFLYLIGNRGMTDWVTLGLVTKQSENTFFEYEYNGGEGFGLNLLYNGYTKVEKTWSSPQILLRSAGDDVYSALEQYCDNLIQEGCCQKIDRSLAPKWWFEPIFGGWGEQVYFSKRWENYFNNTSFKSGDDTYQYCTQAAYEKMLATLESNGVDPTILIIDNRWFDLNDHLSVDNKSWPTMKEFIQKQHSKGRKIILWVSPWSYCRSNGQDIPVSESLILDEEDSYTLEIDTDVFYKACNRNKSKVRKEPDFKTKKITEHDPHWPFAANPFNRDYEMRVRKKIHNLISPEGFDADGIEFDYTHFIPMHRGYFPADNQDILWGAESLKKMMWIYYDQMKKSKADSLCISHTFNPYFNDVVDMLRLQDIYTDRSSIVPQMTHRAMVAKKVCPDCAIHTDQHAMPSLEHWREYARYQPKLGNPCLYYVTGIETTKERLEEEDFVMIRDVWSSYRRWLDEKKSDGCLSA